MAEGTPRRLPAVVLPVLVAVVLTGLGLGSRSLWLDEGATVAIASQHGAALWHAIAHDGGNMLLFYLLLHVVIAVFGSGEVAIRLPSLIAVAALAGMTGLLGLRLLARPLAALAAGLLCAVSLPLVFWGQDARGYALMAALSTASWLAVVWFVSAAGGRRRSGRGALAAYGITTVLALYVGFDAALVIPAQLLVMLGGPARARARSVILTLIAVAIAAVPLAVLAASRGSSQLFWVPGLRGSVLGQAALALLSAGYSPNFHATATTTLTAVLVGGAVLTGVVLAWRDDGAEAWRRRLLAGWLVVPAVLALVAVVAGEPLELARIAVLLLPAVALLLALPLARPAAETWPAPTRGRVSGRWAIGVGVAALLALRALQLAPSYGVSPEDWRSATAAVLAGSRSGACLAFYPQDGRMAFDYYARGRAAATRLTPVLPALPLAQVRPYVERYAAPGPSELTRIARACPRLWVLASHQGQRTGPPASRANLRRYRSLLRSLGRRYAHRTERDFGYAAVVRVTRFSR